MKIRIDGGVVVGWSGTSHEMIPDGSIIVEGSSIKAIGTDKTEAVDKVIDAAGKIVCPGFINLHVQSASPLTAQHRRLSACRRHQKRLFGRQLVRLWCSFKGKS
jgi:dihydroorotase-like cyclic amidohydrolase